MNQKPYHHFMATVRVDFKVPLQPGQAPETQMSGSTTLNTIEVSEEHKFTNAHFASAQQKGVQALEANGLTEADMTGIHILAVSYLGHMTQDEFFTPFMEEAATQGENQDDGQTGSADGEVVGDASFKIVGS